MSNIVELIIRGNDQSAKAIASSVRNLQGLDSALGAVSRQLSGILSVGALVSLGKSALDMAGHLEDASKKFGVSASELSQLQYVAKLSGVEFEDLGGAFKFLAKSISEAENPSSDAALAFKAMGFSVKELKTLSPNEVFMRLADAFSEMKDGANKTALALAIFGRAGANILPVMADGSAGIKKLKEEAVAMGATLSDEQIQKLDGYGDAIDKIGIGAKITAGKLAIDLVDGIKSLWDGVEKYGPAIERFYARVFGGDVSDKSKGIASGKIADILVPNPEPGPKKDAPNIAAIKQAAEKRQKALEDEQKKRLKLAEDYERLHAANVMREGAVVHENLAAEMGWTQEYYDTVSRMRLQDFDDWKKVQEDEAKLLEKFELDKIGMLKDLQDAQRAEDESGGEMQPYRPEDAFNAAMSFGDSESAIMLLNEGLAEHFRIIYEGREKVTAYMDIWQEANRSFSAVALDIGMAARDQLIGTLTNVITGAQKASEAFKALGKAILSMIVEAAMKWIMNRLIMAAIGKSIQAAETAAMVAMGKTIAASWASAAAMVSLGSYGANAVPAMAGIAATVAMSQSLAVPALAEGGIVPATHGGRLVRVAEGGQDEAIIPLDRGARSPTRIELYLDGSVLAAWMADAQRSGVLQLRMA